MKVAGKQVVALLGDPSRVFGMLLYGPDQGLVRDYARRAARAALGDERDAFRLVVLLREEHSRLRDEVASLPLGGGRRVVRVQDVTDNLAAIIQTLPSEARDVLVILEAGALSARSKLRMMAEREEGWAAIACYASSPAAVSGEIVQTLDAAGLSIEPAAVGYLTQELSGDYARRASELEKLCLFAAGDGVVDVAAANACCSGQLDASIVQAVTAAMAGQSELADRLLAELAHEGATGPGLLAVLAMEMHRVLKARVLIDQGSTPEEACRAIVPPIYPRQAPEFLVEVRRWPVARLQRLGALLREADLACKRAGSRDFSIAARLLSAVAADMGRVPARV